MSAPASDGHPEDEALVSASDLSVGYDGRAAIVEVNFEIPAGRRVAILGPNGGGKTTLLHAILGALPPLSGLLEVAVACGVVAQREHARLDYPVSALDVALMGTLSGLRWYQRPTARHRHRAHEALETVGLGGRAEETFGELSGGQRQRVLIARALVQDARLLLLDEPFNGLDRESSRRLEGLIESLAREGRSVLTATHDLAQARDSDLVLCINRRQITFGQPGEVLNRECLTATYGADVVDLPAGGGTVVLPAQHHHHG